MMSPVFMVEANSDKESGKGELKSDMCDSAVNEAHQLKHYTSLEESSSLLLNSILSVSPDKRNEFHRKSHLHTICEQNSSDISESQYARSSPQRRRGLDNNNSNLLERMARAEYV